MSRIIDGNDFYLSPQAVIAFALKTYIKTTIFSLHCGLPKLFGFIIALISPLLFFFAMESQKKEESDDEEGRTLAVGTQIEAMGKNSKWKPGTIAKIHRNKGELQYLIDWDDKTKSFLRNSQQVRERSSTWMRCQQCHQWRITHHIYEREWFLCRFLYPWVSFEGRWIGGCNADPDCFLAFDRSSIKAKPPTLKLVSKCIEDLLAKLPRMALKCERKDRIISDAKSAEHLWKGC